MDSVTVDNRGRPVNIRFYEQDHTSWTNTAFEYNGDDLSRLLATNSNSSTPVITTAIYNNGNMVGLQTTSNVTTLEYYTNEKVQQGDYLEVSGLILYGLTIYPHKNLVKAITAGGNISNFSYEKNSDGLISKLTATSGASVTTYTYQYTCN